MTTKKLIRRKVVDNFEQIDLYVFLVWSEMDSMHIELPNEIHFVHSNEMNKYSYHSIWDINFPLACGYLINIDRGKICLMSKVRRDADGMSNETYYIGLSGNDNIFWFLKNWVYPGGTDPSCIGGPDGKPVGFHIKYQIGATDDITASFFNERGVHLKNELICADDFMSKVGETGHLRRKK